MRVGIGVQSEAGKSAGAAACCRASPDRDARRRLEGWMDWVGGEEAAWLVLGRKGFAVQKGLSEGKVQRAPSVAAACVRGRGHGVGVNEKEREAEGRSGETGIKERAGCGAANEASVTGSPLAARAARGRSVGQTPRR